ncbi:hypothetical protein Tco_0300543 [Tanacetum coccineum]
MKALKLSNSQNLQLIISPLLNQKDTYLMNIFITLNLLKADQNDQPFQIDEIFYDDQSKHSNHTNDEHIIDNLTNTEDVQNTELLSSPTKDTSTPNAIGIEENDVVSKECARNGEWVKISMRKHVNTEILKENKNLRTELKELKAITKTWLNSSNKVNQCISEQIPSQKKRILGVDQLTEDPSSSGQKDLVFVKSSANDTKVTIPGVERPWLSEAEGFILPNHDTGRILPAESQRNTTDVRSS